MSMKEAQIGGEAGERGQLSAATIHEPHGIVEQKD